jgi:hypothetical protein
VDNLDWKSVTSSNVERVAYDEEGGHLYVSFRSGTYRYHHVPREVYEQLLEAPSPGRLMRSNVVPAYDCERIE